MWYSGQEGALATLDVLTGAVNPAGRLPVSFPKKLEDTAVHAKGHPERYAIPGRCHEKDWVAPNIAEFTEGIYIGYRHFDQYDIEPEFAFGYGLSYTKFAYSDLRIGGNAKEGFRVSVTVTNTGKRDGDEVVQCYLGRPDTVPEGVQVAPQSLTDFKRIFVKSGESERVTLEIPYQSLCYWKVLHENNQMDPGEGWTLLHGERKVRVSASSRDVRLTQSIIV